MSESDERDKARLSTRNGTYLRCLQQENISQKHWPYYVAKVRLFIKAASSSDPMLLDRQEVERVLLSSVAKYRTAAAHCQK